MATRKDEHWGNVDSVKQLNLGTLSLFVPEENFFSRGTMQVLGTADRFTPQTGYAGDKLWRYLKFRAQPKRKLSQGRRGWASPLYGICAIVP